MPTDLRPSGSAFRRVWRLLPERLRTAPLATRLKQTLGVARAPGVAAPPAESHGSAIGHPHVRMLDGVDELDEVLVDLNAAAAVSDDELRRRFETFAMRTPVDLPADPDSIDYRQRQLDLYARLHGAPYRVANEISAFDPIGAADRPFPYQTGSARTVAGQLIAIGFLIRTLNLAPGSRVLELGAGWGNTTVALARMGHRVTALDIESNFLALIAERARRKRLDIETIHGDFSIAGSLNRTFDAVLFFESFHHSSNHQALIASLDRIVDPAGQVVFAGEPISADFPIPWGLRLDGQSLWAIRQQGWLELGFREDYFLDLLHRSGWTATKSVCSELTGAEAGWGTVYVARRTAAVAPALAGRDGSR
jgi:2-polyprenyl-3-methyl-5-hydroxy-6-metoxy-1,4-benzoquinol methylase